MSFALFTLKFGPLPRRTGSSQTFFGHDSRSSASRSYLLKDAVVGAPPQAQTEQALLVWKRNVSLFIGAYKHACLARLHNFFLCRFFTLSTIKK